MSFVPTIFGELFISIWLAFCQPARVLWALDLYSFNKNQKWLIRSFYPQIYQCGPEQIFVIEFTWLSHVLIETNGQCSIRVLFEKSTLFFKKFGIFNTSSYRKTENVFGSMGKTYNG